MFFFSYPLLYAKLHNNVLFWVQILVYKCIDSNLFCIFLKSPRNLKEELTIPETFKADGDDKASKFLNEKFVW